MSQNIFNFSFCNTSIIISSSHFLPYPFLHFANPLPEHLQHIPSVYHELLHEFICFIQLVPKSSILLLKFLVFIGKIDHLIYQISIICSGYNLSPDFFRYSFFGSSASAFVASRLFNSDCALSTSFFLSVSFSSASEHSFFIRLSQLSQ